MRTSIVFLFFAYLIVPLSADARQIEYDAAITQDTVKFSPQPFFAGESVRVYTDLQNLGSQDISGQVSFYQGPNLLRSAVPFFLRSGGVSQGVWIDWTPAEGTYNIMVKVDTDPADQNSTNNAYITPMMTIAKRPLPPLPPPIVIQQPQPAPVVVASTAPAQKQMTQEQSIVKKIAQSVAEKITPKLPVNPPAERRTLPSTTKAVVREQKQQIALQGEAVAPALGDSSQPVPVPIGTVDDLDEKTTPAVQDRSLTEGLPSRKQRDPARMLLIAGILLAVCSLGVGGYFMHKSRA